RQHYQSERNSDSQSCRPLSCRTRSLSSGLPILGSSDPNVQLLANFDPTQHVPPGVPDFLQFLSFSLDDFSLDDDVADQMEYTAGAPFGVVSANATVKPGDGTHQATGSSTGTAAISFTQATRQILFMGMAIGTTTPGYSVPANIKVTGITYQTPG